MGVSPGEGAVDGGVCRLALLGGGDGGDGGGGGWVMQPCRPKKSAFRALFLSLGEAGWGGGWAERGRKA